MKIKMYEKDGYASPSREAAARFGSGAQPPKELEADVYVLCAGRHPLPEGLEGRADYVYHYIGSPLNFGALEIAAQRAFAKVGAGEKVYIYVTGLAPALIAALNALREKGTAVTLLHYDRRTLGYRPQHVY